ncbi:MAG: NTP transferase domain-containing protein [Promethearchaeota archaeon]
MVEALILAAGEGLRFLPFTEKNPKCLFKVPALGREVLADTVSKLSALSGLSAIHVVGGHLGEIVRSFVEELRQATEIPLHYYSAVPEYEEGSLFSFIRGASELGGDRTVLVPGDTIFTKMLLESFVGADPSGGVVVAVHSPRPLSGTMALDGNDLRGWGEEEDLRLEKVDGVSCTVLGASGRRHECELGPVLTFSMHFTDWILNQTGLGERTVVGSLTRYLKEGNTVSGKRVDPNSWWDFDSPLSVVKWEEHIRHNPTILGDFS